MIEWGLKDGDEHCGSQVLSQLSAAQACRSHTAHKASLSNGSSSIYLIALECLEYEVAAPSKVGNHLASWGIARCSMRAPGLRSSCGVVGRGSSEAIYLLFDCCLPFIS